jgi:hypothetical protein
MKVRQKLIRLAVLAAGALAVVPASASAGIWTPVASGTTAGISAIDEVNASTLVYGTNSGQILKNGVVKSTNPGFSINDIQMNPSGTIGVATASNGRLLISANGGETWAVKSLANTTYTEADPCSGTPPAGGVKNNAPAGNLNAVSWASDTVAYVVASDLGVVLKTTNAGTNWTDFSRQADGTCFVNTGGDLLTDVQAIPGSDVVWALANDFGTRYISTNGLTSSALQLSDTAVNCFDTRPRLALDFDSPNRAFVADRCGSTSALGFTQDGGSSFNFSQSFLAGDGAGLELNDVAIAGSSIVAVGNAGAILIDSDGSNAYFQRADGANTTNSWLSVDKLDATHAAVGGANGVLLTTAQATTIPDIVAPAGTVTGPTTVAAGTPATYTANVADNAGGSGIDPAGFAWSAQGVPPAAGNPATFTFPSPGFYLVSVSFKDLSGNAATTSLSVNVTAPVVPPPVKPTKTTTASVPGAKISFGTPNTCVKAGSTFKVTLTWKKQKRKGNKFVKVRRADFYIGTKRAKIDKKAPFTQTLKVTASTKKGSTITVKARAYIKVTKGKSPTKSISSKIKVCS